MRYLNWEEFDTAIIDISKKVKYKNFSGVYGIPRGGLCLAVALSHELEIPLKTQPIKRTLIIDDICESGKTINKYIGISETKVIVWISKVKPNGWEALEVTNSREWIVMPWENKNNAIIDKKNYVKSKKYNSYE